MATIPHLAQVMQAVLGPGADAAARATGFVRRRSKLTGARFVQALVFGWLADPQASLEALCQTAAALGVAIRPQSLDERFTEAAAACLERVLAAAVAAAIAADPVAVPALRRFPGGVWLHDSTVIRLPRALAARWPGCGGSRGQNAALKLQVRHDLLTGALEGPLLQPGRAQDRSAPPPPRAAALRLADLGYFSLANLAAWSAAGGEWLGRVQANTLVVTADGQRWALATLLRARAAAGLDQPVTLGLAARLPCRLLAAPAPPAVAAQRRDRLHEEARRKGQPVSPERLAVCDWTVLVTNVPPERLSLAEALTLARARWQVELLFKLWKGHNRIDEWRGGKPWRALCEVYAKLLGAIVQHWLLLVGCWRAPDRSLTKAAQTVRRHGATFLAAFRHGDPARLIAAIDDLAAALAAGCRINKRHARPPTHQLLLAFADAAAPEAAPTAPAPALAP